jgi:DNA-directed RNA polymerase sigma subunit (sigma70/sigma32)
MTPLEALMSTPPHHEPQVSQLELLVIRDLIQDAIEDCLTPLEQWVFNATIVERQSLRGLGRQINRPKTTVARIRDRALLKLRGALADSPAIIEYLTRHEREHDE